MRNTNPSDGDAHVQAAAAAVRRRRARAARCRATTLDTHHGKHHAAYIKKTNAALAERADAPEDAGRRRAPRRAREGQEALQQRRASLESRLLLAMPHARSRRAARRATASGDREDASARSTRSARKPKPKGEGHFASGWLWLVADATGAVQLHGSARRAHADRRSAPSRRSSSATFGSTPIISITRTSAANSSTRFFDKLANWRFAEAQYAAARNGGAGAWRFPA